MANIVYVHAYVKDRQIVRDLSRFYFQVRDAGIGGLENVRPVLGKRGLDGLLDGQPVGFQDAINQYPFEGVGIWTEWSDGNHIDEFYRSQLHNDFSKYTRDKLDRAWFRIIQFRDGEVTTREVR